MVVDRMIAFNYLWDESAPIGADARTIGMYILLETDVRTGIARVSVDALIARSTCTRQQVQGGLRELELAGYLRQTAPGEYMWRTLSAKSSARLLRVARLARSRCGLRSSPPRL